MKRVWILLVVLALTAVACGGGDADSGSEDTEGALADTTTSISEGQEPSGDTITTTTSAGQVADVTGVGEATVTIEGETYYFGEGSLGAFQCEPDFFGVFIVALGMVDESGAEIPSGGNLQLALLLDGTDPAVVDQLPEVNVGISAKDEDWSADEEATQQFDQLEPGSSQVDDYTIDGLSASGTATFFEKNSYFAFLGGAADSIRTTQGQFEVTCADG
jgi:hypothetical protein